MKHFIILLALILLLPLSALASNMIGTPNVDTVNIRKEPSTQSNKLGEAKRGQQIEIIGEVVNKKGDKWYQIEMGNGRTGYVSAQFIDIKSGQMPSSQNQTISSAGFPAATAVPRITPFPDVTPFRTAAPSPTPTTLSSSKSNEEKSYTKVKLGATNEVINIPVDYVKDKTGGNGSTNVVMTYVCDSPVKNLQVMAYMTNPYDPSSSLAVFKLFALYYEYMDALYTETIGFDEESYTSEGVVSFSRFAKEEGRSFYYNFFYKQEKGILIAVSFITADDCKQEFLNIVSPMISDDVERQNKHLSKEEAVKEKKTITELVDGMERTLQE